jgi:GT2 family glycosyltransferase
MLDHLTAVSIVVPTYRRPDALASTLAALGAVEYPSDLLEVIVVDDGMDEETQKTVAGFARDGLPVTYVAQDREGAAAGRNRGARHASGSLLIFLDDDMIVEPSHVNEHLATRARYGDCLVNGHWEFSREALEVLAESPFGDFRIWIENWVKDGIAKVPLDDSSLEPAEVTAANLGIAREAFFALGGFDENFPLAGCEDQDFSYRAKKAGYRFVYNNNIRLFHNDRRVTLRQFCGRQEQGATTAVFLAAKHPEEYADRSLMTENGPITRADPPRVAAKKAAKWLLSTPPSLALVHRTIDFLERRFPQSRALRRAYWATCGIYIYRGVRRGRELVEAP